MLTPVVEAETSIAVRLPVSTKLTSVGASAALMIPVLVIELTVPDWSMIAATVALVAAVSEIEAAIVPLLTMPPTFEFGPMKMACAVCGVEAVMLAVIAPSLTIWPALTPPRMIQCGRVGVERGGAD